jgi:hypothetical protein
MSYPIAAPIMHLQQSSTTSLCGSGDESSFVHPGMQGQRAPIAAPTSSRHQLLLNPFLQQGVSREHLDIFGRQSMSSSLQPSLRALSAIESYSLASMAPGYFPVQTIQADGNIGSLSRKQADHQANTRDPVPKLQRKYGRVEPLAAVSDKDALCGLQYYARQQIEFFEAVETDVAHGTRGRNNPIMLGQVGIRCRHCANDKPSNRGRAAVYFPTKYDLVYQTAVNMTSTHLCNHCKKIPKEVRDELTRLRDQRSAAGGGKKYWAKATKDIGIVETNKGLRFKE